MTTITIIRTYEYPSNGTGCDNPGVVPPMSSFDGDDEPNILPIPFPIVPPTLGVVSKPLV